jgi:predicted HTH transcriptional regulator
LLFQIPAAPIGLPVAWEGHYYGRDGEELSPLNIEEMERIRRHGIITDWSAAICHDATIADIDREKVNNFVNIAQAKRGFPIKPGTSIKIVANNHKSILLLQ